VTLEEPHPEAEEELMEIYLDKRAVKTIRLSAADAIEEGDTESLKDDIIESFPEDQIEALEQMLGGTDFVDLIGEILDEWSGDDVDELFELLETQLGDLGIDLKVFSDDDDDDDEEEEDDDDDDFEEEDDEKDEVEAFDEYEEPGFEDDL
jgi:hypothetical protein